jgi:hypothetical protein
MSPRRILLLTTVVVLLFAFILLFERKMPTTAERREKGDLVWDIPDDRVDRLELQHGGTTVELKKQGTGWSLVKPESYPADSASVSDALAQLARLKRASVETAEGRPEDYGFKSPSARAVVVSRSNGKANHAVTHTVEFGVDIPGTDLTAARISTDGPVFFVPTSVASAAKKSGDDFKSRDVFAPGLDAARVDVERGRGRLALSRKNGVWWLVQPVSDLANADEVQRVTGDLTALRALDFVPAAERQNLAALGLAPALYRVTLADSRGAATTVEFGATKSDGNSVYARRDGQVFTVPSSTIEEVSKEATAFREPRLVRFERSAVTEATGAFSQESFTLSRKDGGWTSGGRSLLAASADDALTAILDLKSRSFLEDSDAAGLRSGHAVATVSVKTSPGEPWTISLFPHGGDTQALVSGRPGAFLLTGDVVATLRTAFRKASSSPAATPTAAKPTPASVKKP